LIWQEFIADNDHDIRVCLCGDNLFGLKRWIRSPDMPFASGSGKRETIKSLSDPLIRAAFKMTVEISEAIGARWVCYDFVFRDGVPLVLEMSFSWVEKAYDECVCFDRKTLQKNGRTAASWAEFAVDELERIAK
jgi:hypothetical protein